MADQMMQHNADELAAKQTIPAGFKWTEIGIIPEDWIIERLGMYASFRTGPFGSALHKSDYVIDGIPIVNPMQIIDGGIIPTSSMSISTTAATKLSEFRLQTGDIVIGRRGEMGRCAVVGIEENGWLCGTGSMIIRIKSSCESRFIQRVLSSKEIIAAIESSSVGTTMINLNQSTLRELKIFIPSNKNEQLAIATVLSDTDALISGLEQLIAKKQAIKTATMQQLLTGRTRLPQFALLPDGTPKGYKSSELGQIPEDWEVRYLKEVCGSFKTGKLDANAMKTDGEYRFYTCARSYYWIDSYAFDDDALLISGNGANVGYIHHYNGKFNAYQRTYVLTSFYSDIHFVKLQMEVNLSERIRVEVNAGNTPYITMDTLTDMCICLPKSIEEQTAIATILSDIDSELTALEQKLAKARDVKQGMMQQLLTGRIRLPVEQVE
ncbi:hypothetical protein KAM344_37170 [Aeromonas caviae]|uniref:restriction endonuclease subunit S n=1 Tax=Aeromonas caviae TaxID=648 RepID=UPI001FC7F7D0|nr:restriction endonuclease subunit S [Aeromonas caviae]GKQ68552.1 hypothetical protein KAM344_37170 [Aeromonas caviae]